MGPSPGAHPFHIGRTTKVVPVLRFAQPTALTGSLTRLAAGRLRTVVLVVSVAWVRKKKLMAVFALTFTGLLHWRLSYSTPMMENPIATVQLKSRKNTFKKKTEERKKWLEIEMGKKMKNKTALHVYSARKTALLEYR
jgi:hypothetical protein